MKKTILTVMAAVVIATTGTAFAATPERAENVPAFEQNVNADYTCGGYGRGGRGRGGYGGGYGCGGYGGGYGGGYCYDGGYNSENNQ